MLRSLFIQVMARSDIWLELEYDGNGYVDAEWLDAANAAKALGRRVWPWNRKKLDRTKLAWPDGSEGYALLCDARLKVKYHIMAERCKLSLMFASRSIPHAAARDPT